MINPVTIQPTTIYGLVRIGEWLAKHPDIVEVIKFVVLAALFCMAITSIIDFVRGRKE